MPRFTISSRTLAPVRVDAPNWIVALGHALEGWGLAADVPRLSCEVMANGSVIARDGTSKGRGFVVEPDAPVGLAAAMASSEVEHAFGGASGDLAHPARVRPERSAEAPAPAWSLPEPGTLGRARLLPPTPSPDEAAEQARDTLRAALAAVPSASGGALLWSDGAGLVYVAALGPGASLHRARRTSRGGLAGYCIEQARTVLLLRAVDDPRHDADLDALSGRPAEAVLCVPALDDSGRAHGALILVQPMDGPRFTRAASRKIRTLLGGLIRALVSP